MVFWMYYKNLQYIQTDNRLNSCQARWSLFFKCFVLPHLIAQIPKTTSLTPSFSSFRRRMRWTLRRLSPPLVLLGLWFGTFRIRTRLHFLTLLHPVIVEIAFSTRLPPSEGYTVVLFIVDRFSKSENFIPLHKLPSGKDRLLMIHYVFSPARCLLGH